MAGIGQALLLTSVLIAFAAALASIVPGVSTPLQQTRVATRAALALMEVAALCLAAATIALMVALLRNDFSIAYVADTSRRAMSAPYRAAAVWGAMDGSLLVWTALLGGVSAIYARRLLRSALTVSPLAITFPAALTGAFAAITLSTANPFRTLQVPATDGSGLLPILQHPAMLYHPPLLYLGLVSLTPPFSLTIGALANRTLDDAWRVRCRRLMFVPWIVLAAGMVAGANWAYVELGWGGYWAWDPIENTSLLPWLAVNAFLHQSIRKSENASSHSNLFGAGLVLIAFVVAILGTLLTRSGAASSVHAFAQDTAVGRALFGLTVVVALACLYVFAMALQANRAGADGSRRREESVVFPPTRLFCRDGLLRLGVLVGVLALGLVLAGTLSPVVRSLFGGSVTAVDGPYFATMTTPLVWLALVVMGIAPGLDARRHLHHITFAPALVGLATSAGLAAFGWASAVTLITGGLAGFAGSSAVIQGWQNQRGPELLRSRLGRGGPHIAHFGFAMLLLGFAGSTAAHSSTVLLGQGRTAVVDGVEFRNDGVRVDNPDSDEPRVVIAVHVQRGSASRELEPGITGFRVLGQRLADTALWSEPSGDVQIALRDANDNGNALVEIHTRPLAPLVWWGGLLLIVGGLLAATRRRRPVDHGGSRCIEKAMPSNSPGQSPL